MSTNNKKGNGIEIASYKWIVGSLASAKREMKMLKQLKRFRKVK